MNSQNNPNNTHYIVSIKNTVLNSSLVDDKNNIKPSYKRSIHYDIISSEQWNSIKQDYDKEIPIKDVYNVHITFNCNGESKKNIKVYGVETVYDVILSLFVNKMFDFSSFKRMLIVYAKIGNKNTDANEELQDVMDAANRESAGSRRYRKDRRCCSDVEIDPIVPFSWFKNTKEVFLRVERRVATPSMDSAQVEDIISNSSFDYTDKSEESLSTSRNRGEYSSRYSPTSNFISYLSSDCQGIPNIGNTCFMNAAIQCLNNCENFVEFFLKHDFNYNNGRDGNNNCRDSNNNSRDSNNNSRDSNNNGRDSNNNGRDRNKRDSKIVQTWANLLRSMHKNECIPIRQFKNSMGKINSVYHDNDQQDSFEFLNALLSELHEELKEEHEPSEKHPENKTADTKNEAAPEKNKKELQREWNRLLSKESSPVLYNFYGMTTTILKCTECRKCIQKHDPYMSLSLPIPDHPLVHSGIIFVPLNSRLPLRICVPLEYTVENLIKYVKKRYFPKDENTPQLLPVLYKDSWAQRCLDEEEKIRDTQCICLFELANKNSICQINYKKFIIFREKLPIDFIVPYNIDTQAMHIAVYNKLRHLMTEDLTTDEFYEIAELRECGYDPIFRMPLLRLNIRRSESIEKSLGKLKTIGNTNKSGVTLNDCILSFTKEERVDYPCDKCNKSTKYTLNTLLSKMPDILIIHLKRLRYLSSETKITTRVSFPVDGMKINGCFYRLIATCNHVEVGLCCGHYIAYINRNSKWYCCNDAVISVCKGPDIRNAYILFYEKIQR